MKKKQKVKAYVDSDVVEVEGSQEVKDIDKAKREALKNLKSKVDSQLVKTTSERAVAAEKDGDSELLKKMLKKIKELKK